MNDAEFAASMAQQGVPRRLREMYMTGLRSNPAMEITHTLDTGVVLEYDRGRHELVPRRPPDVPEPRQTDDEFEAGIRREFANPEDVLLLVRLCKGKDCKLVLGGDTYHYVARRNTLTKRRAP